MPTVCTNADRQPRPCKDTPFSREIICKAGHPNTCLKNCNSACPSYQAHEAPRQISPRSAVNTPRMRSFDSPQYSPSSSQETPVAAPTALSDASVNGRNLSPRSSCGGCGGKN